MKNQITNLITKIISILVIMLMMLNSSLMLVISVAVDAVQKIIDETKINAVYELNMEKYVNYKMGDKQGTLVQTYLKTGIEYQEGQEYVPIDTSNVIINTPKINDKYPESVEVVTKSTKATNGDGSGKDVNYAYNKENGQLQIITENKADDKGNIYTENVAGARDEYQLDFYYDADCYNDKNEKRSLEFKGNVELKLKDDRDIRKNQEISQNFEVAENVSGLVSADVTTSDIYNGYINANIQNNSTYRKEYTENVKIQTSFKEIADEITVNTKNLLVNNKDKENETQEIIYKNTKVNKNEILDKLGQDGYFQIIDKDGNILATINKDTEADENGNIQIGYDEEKTELNFKFSKPLKLGDINILNTKEIKDTMKDENVTKVETRNTVSCVNNVTEKTKVIDEETKEEKEVENTKQVEIYNYVGTSVAEIKEAKTDVKVTANNTNWTNNVQNDVTFTVTLVTSGPEYNLFKNPVIDIKLPNEVEKVVLGESSILYDSGLQLGSVQVVDDNGSKVIRVKVNGTQTSYVQNEVVNGANIVIPASIILKKDIVSSQENIAVSFANYRNAKSPEIGNLDIPVNVTSIINNNASANEQNSNNGASANGVATNFAAVSAQATLATANNTVVEAKPIDLDKISVEYKAFLGDKELADGDSVHENEYIKYVAKVRNNTGEDVNGLNVVASVPEGTTYVTIENRELTEEDKNYQQYDQCKLKEDENIKNIIKTISLKNGEELEISFYVKVNLLASSDNSEKIKSVIKLNNSKEDKVCSELDNTVRKSEITARVNAWETTRDCNVWLYEISVTNNTNQEIRNIKVNLDLDGKFVLSHTIESENTGVTTNGNSFSYTIDKIVAKSNNSSQESEMVGTPENTYLVDIYVKAITTQDSENMVNANVNVEYNNNLYYTNPNIQNIKMPIYTITQSSDKEGEEIKYGEEVEYVFTIKNESKIPRNLNFDFNDYLDENMKTISVKYENYVIDSNSETMETYKKEFEEELGYISDTWDKDVVCNLKLLIPNGKDIKIKIKATPKMVYENTETENYAILKYNYNGTFVKISNSIKNTILVYGKDNGDNPDKPNPDKPNPDKPDPDNPDPDNPNPDKPDNPSDSKYTISGIVWNDENKNGLMDTNEKKLSGIIVKLFNIETNEIVMVNNEKQIKTTDNSGSYEFTEISKGKYIVLFEYDTNLYKLTSYKVSGGSEEAKSNVINKSVNIDGVEKIVAITDNIDVEKTNLKNINMGLIENGILNLKLNKVITNVKLQNNGNTQEYNYNDTKLAKVEIPTKKIEGTIVTIKYKIEIKNNGTTETRVNSIVDYKPEGLDFDAKLNPGWSIDGNNNIKYYAFAEKKLKAGESVSVDLYLTKKLSKDEMGTFTNSAKILEISNDQNIKGVEYTTENNYSEAQIVVSVKTGVVLFGVIFVIILMILGFIIYLFRKKRIRFGKVKKITLTVILMFLATVTMFGNVAEAALCWTSTLQTHFGDTSSDNNFFWFENMYGNTVKGWAHGYLTHGLDPVENFLYCTDGKDMAFINRGAEDNSGAWTYSNNNNDKYYSESITSYGEPSAKAIIKEATPGEAKGSYVGVDSSNCIIGPYRITFNGSIKSISFEGNGIDSKNSDKIKICKNKNGEEGSIVSGVDFYIKIPINIGVKYLNKITIENEVNTTRKEYYSWSCEEEWTTGEHAGKDPQILHRPRSGNGEREIPANNSNFVEIDISKSLFGDIKIVKSDSDNTSTKLSGATFEITGPNNYSETKTTDANGTITISNLPLGIYTVKETGAPTGYRLNLQENTTNTISVTSGGTATVDFYNKQYGDFKVTKKDKDTGKTTLGDIKLEGVQFKLYVIKNGTKYYLKNATQTKYSYDDFSETDRDKAKTYSTDTNGQFSESNLPVKNGKDDIEYYIEEYALPEALKNYYKVKTTPDKITLINGNQQDKDILNKQIYIGLSGYVWEDVANPNKQTTRNDLYDEGETLVQGVTVRLKSTIKEDEGTIQTTTTNASGQYKFNKVKIDQLSNYYIEFEYNGLKYQSVAYHNQDNGSKAIEGDTTRDNFNNQYASITGGNAKGTTTTGYSKNASGTVTNNLTYTNGTYSSQLVQNTGYTVESAKKSVSAQNGSSGVSIKATTHETGYSLDKWSAGVTEIGKINLGIYARAQSDMKIATDLKDYDLILNKYKHTYKYNQRSRSKENGIDIFSEIQKWNKTDKQKENENNQYPKKYETSIYKNYIYASASEGYKNEKGKVEGKLDEADKLKMYLNYKIDIQNSSTVYMSANEIARYYNDILEYSSSYYLDEKESKHNIDWKEYTNSNGYKQIRTTGLSGIKIKPGEQKTIYLTLKVKDDEVASWGLGSKLNVVAYGVTEITSYSNYVTSGDTFKYYAAIDKNSAPDNATPGKINTYEDDTDAAPELKITFAEPRTITGSVFEDSTGNENKLTTNCERKGNGKIDKGEGKIQNVKVQLIKTDGSLAYVYPKAVSKGEFDAKPAEYTTKDNGYYEFVGVIPGDYYIKFTYGNYSTIYNKDGKKLNNISTQDYKSTIISSATLKEAYGESEEYDLGKINKNPRWYQGLGDDKVEYSTAVDDYEKRNEINDYYKTITAKNKVVYDNGGGKQTITARTLNMKMAVENYNNETTVMNEDRHRVYSKIDFGIALRPRQSLTLYKNITHIKLKLSGGEVVADGDPSNKEELKNMKYVTYPEKGILKIEADNEIIQGATLEIQYTISIENNSEKDYNDVKYYRYGTVKTGSKPVDLKVNTVVDYLDEALPKTYTDTVSNSDWYVAQKSKVKELTTSGAYNDVKNRNNILLRDCNTTISIGKTAKITPIKTSKILSTIDSVDIKNFAEVVSVSNDVGKFYGGVVNDTWKNMTPGSLQLSDYKGTSELDNNQYPAELAVVTSTGDSTMVYYILGITCLGIIICGIILIKKFVL